MKAWLKRLAVLLAILSVVALAVQGMRTPPVLIDTETAEVGPLSVTVQAEGRTRVIDRYEVSAPIAAQTRRIELNVGDSVKVGDPLVVLDAVTPPALDARSLALARANEAAAKAALLVAQGEARAATATARFARQEQTRLKSLVAQGHVSKSQLDQATAEMERAEAINRSAEFRVRTAEHQLEAAQAALAYLHGEAGATAEFHLRAPISGQVLARPLQSATVVQPGTTLLELGDPSRLEIVVDVLSSDAVRIEPNMPVLLERWGLQNPLQGVVSRIEPVAFTKVSALGIEEQRVNVIVDFRSPPESWSRLGDGYRVDARFILWASEQTLRIPSSSVFRHQGKTSVFVVDGDRVRLQPVTLGRNGGLQVQVESGLAAGDQVVVHPPREVRDGSQVRLRE